LSKNPQMSLVKTQKRTGARNLKINRHQNVISIDPERLSGTPCFVGTRVPIQSLFDHLEAGDSLGVFLEDFDGVSSDQAIAVLELARLNLLSGLAE